MKKFCLYFLFAVMLTSGFLLPSCNRNPCNCPDLEGDFFNIEGMDGVHFEQDGDCCGSSMLWQNYILNINFSLSFFSHNEPDVPKWDMGLMPSAYACDCVQNGWNGSMEKLEDISVVSLNNFNASHPAGSDISNLVNVVFYPDEFVLTDFILQQDTSNIDYYGFSLTLREAPDTDEAFRPEVRVSLTNGEEYVLNGDAVDFF